MYVCEFFFFIVLEKYSLKKIYKLIYGGVYTVVCLWSVLTVEKQQCMCVCEGVCSNIVFVFPKQLLFSFCIVHTLYYRDGLIFHLRITKTRRQKMNRVYVTLFIV